MAHTLVILESPGKVKNISNYLGKGYEVVASYGNLIDLPEKELGVEVDEDFKPKYVVIKTKGSKASKILKQLEASAKKSDKILIATDPDREGEVIGWHIANYLGKLNKDIKRITFNEITKKGVLSGIRNETTINIDLVNAQQARRIMDRLVGYKVSPVLWKVISRGLSAGRVQSVALRIIVERDFEIEEFKPEEYWSVNGVFLSKKKEEIITDLVKIGGKAFKLENQEIADKTVEDIKKGIFKVSNIKKRKTKKAPKPPFITSTILQEGVKVLNFTSKKVMSIAQQLYEGVEIGKNGSVGLITYMRTDSTRVSADAIDELRGYIGKKFGMDYIVKNTRIFKSKKNSQDAHEAIRPTGINYEPKKIAQYLTKDQLRLYTLIWSRFIATQMKDAIFNQTTIEVSSDKYLFKISGQQLHYKGFLQVYSDDTFDESSNDSTKLLPKNIDVGEIVNIKDILTKQHFTKPPGRYNEASLTKELEEQGIGRPSTYATIISRLTTQKYIEKKQKQLLSTELGKLVNKFLVGSFPDIFNIKFTKQMEASLDDVEYGETNWVKVLKDFYGPFDKALNEIMEKKDELKSELSEKTGEVCPDCGNDLFYKWGRNGKFIACSNFPECKYTKSILSKEEAEQEKEVVGKCDKCGSDLVVKHGRYGKFIACSNYPKCKNIIQEKVDIKCPKKDCDGELGVKRSKRGTKFYGCSNYPTCKFVMWSKPIEQTCPNCGFPLMGEVVDKTDKTKKLVCPECKHEITESED